MNKFVSSLRTQILVGLTALLVAAMALTSFVILRVTERDLLQYKEFEGLAVARQLQAVVDEDNRQGRVSDDALKARLCEGVSWLEDQGRYGKITVVGKDGVPWAGDSDLGSAGGRVYRRAEEVLRSGEASTTIDAGGAMLTVAAPIVAGGERIAVVSVPVRIDAVVDRLRASRLIVWFYIGLNVLVLVVFGNFLLSRTVIRPIKRLVRLTEHFEESDPFSIMARADRNEIGRLALALNQMLRRLADNKHRLEEQVRSLEAANLELKQAREEVLRSEKLSSLGRLAAGVAHEVGNPIGAILGYTNLLRDYVAGAPEAADYLRRVEEEITRINTIVRELLDFSRPTPSEPAPLDVSLAIAEATSFLGQGLMASVKTQTIMPEGVGMVWADSNQLKQVLINLMLNACDAMEQGGSLTITGRKLAADIKGPGKGEYAGKGFVEISVSDTGKGIAASEIDKIFDPFYSTKPPGKGTGLGLAICLRIIESFGGRISVESTEGEGSTFTIQLPAWEPSNDTK